MLGAALIGRRGARAECGDERAPSTLGRDHNLATTYIRVGQRESDPKPSRGEGMTPQPWCEVVMRSDGDNPGTYSFDADVEGA